MNLSPISYQQMSYNNYSKDIDSSVSFKNINTNLAKTITKGVVPAGAALAAMAGVNTVISANYVENDGYKNIYDENNNLKRKEKYYYDFVDSDPKSMCGLDDCYWVVRQQTIEFYDNGNIKSESYQDGYVVKEYDKNGKLIMLREGDRPALRYDNEGNPIKPYTSFDVAGFEKRINYLTKVFNDRANACRTDKMKKPDNLR